MKKINIPLFCFLYTLCWIWIYLRYLISFPYNFFLAHSKSPIKWEVAAALELVLSFHHLRLLHRLLRRHPMASVVAVRSGPARWPSELDWRIFLCLRQHWNAQDVNQPTLSSVTSTITASLSLATFARLVEGNHNLYSNYIKKEKKTQDFIFSL